MDKRKQVIEKFAIELKRKFNKKLLQKGFSYNQLVLEITNLFTENEFKRFDYNVTILKLEKGILDILNGMEDLQKPNVEIKTCILENKPVIPVNNLSGVKKLELKEKEKSEWAIIAKNNYNKHLQDEKERKLLENEKKLQIKQFLNQQIEAKNEQKAFEKSEKEKTKLLEKDELSAFQEIEKLTRIEKLKKINEQKEIQENLILQNKEFKDRIRKENETIDKKMLEKAKFDTQIENSKNEKKKLAQKDLAKNLIEDNKKRENLKQIEKEKELWENIKAQEEYSNYIEKQEQARREFLKEKIEKVNSLVNKCEITQKQNKIFEEKFLKEQEIIEKK
jgi:hypothetical protein